MRTGGVCDVGEKARTGAAAARAAAADSRRARERPVRGRKDVIVGCMVPLLGSELWCVELASIWNVIEEDFYFMYDLRRLYPLRPDDQ